ncbi:NAD+ synthase [Terrimonas sp. NA20]|uniref:Glutamine-dependent NAD(+) synthetase n=1 Tax=Terrimonas ginsenosidimutans TaxID=2908004 RepID=A0ABS9L001_9BACT|nr:NAD+ synthase [Terrimonas ginsenosidimutans]MCG2617899.1 NAD+ synthase [Terrimonas ginsenosidimutans]
MKIALAQQNYHIGNFEENTRKIIEGIEWAKKQGADLVVFSELCICGYPPRDFLEFDDFINKCYTAVDEIREHADTIGVLIGAPARNLRVEGKDLFNAAFFLYEKKIVAEVHKTLLPNYDIFDEYRYFEPAFEWNLVSFKGKKLAVTICEDIWNMGSNPLYRVTPMEMLVKDGPDMMINLSASPYNYAQDIVRNSLVKAHTLKYGIPMFYCNTVGSQTEIVFDGGSLVYDAAGNKVAEMKYFEEDYQVFDLAAIETFAAEKTVASDEPVYFSSADVGVGEDTIRYLTNEKNMEEIYHALTLGIRDYFSKMGFTKAILGASGGIDSAVVQALAVAAIGKENVRAVLMPSPYSSGHSVEDARQLSENLGNPYDIVPIKEVYESFLSTLSPIFKDSPFGIAEENIQSRTRGNLLMAISNKFGYILLNTSNKSELATGYGTLYGDMAGGLGVLGDLYKMQVFALARYINRSREIIPANIITKPPSAELRPNQKDSDSLPEYDTLDRVLYQYIEQRNGPKEIIKQGFDPVLVARVLRLVNNNEYKRNQFCPIIRISTKAFGVGRRVPIVGKYLS